MRTKTLVAAALAAPLLLMACDRPEQTPTTAVPSQERQAREQGAPDAPMNSAPQSSTGSSAPASPQSSGSSSGNSVTDRPSEPAK